MSESIDTVVLLMMENRSFDHYFGALSLVEGRADVDGLRAELENRDSSGRAVHPAPADASCIDDPGHSWGGSHRQFNDGANDAFVLDYEARTDAARAHRPMGFFDRASLPALYGLADRFTLCQRWFCSVMSSTWPNRFYSLAAQSKGVRTNDESVDYDMPTIYDALGRAGRTWGVYYGNVSFSLIFSRNYPRERFFGVEQFFEDAAAGTLPNFTMVEPIYGRNDDHPPGHPLAGQIFISQIYEALASSPQWRRCLFVVTYDEHGGFYDHVPPPKVPDDRAADGFDQLGFRVPSIVAGPYVSRGRVTSTVFDHTSVLATLHSLFETTPLTTRDRSANDLLELLDLDRLDAGEVRPGEALPAIEADDSVIYAPECTRGLGLARASPGSLTGQPELERFLDARPHPGDRRRSTDEVYEVLLRRAVKRGVLRRR